MLDFYFTVYWTQFIPSFRLSLWCLFKSTTTQRRSRHSTDTMLVQLEFHAEVTQATASEGLAHQPVTFQTKGDDSTNCHHAKMSIVYSIADEEGIHELKLLFMILVPIDFQTHFLQGQELFLNIESTVRHICLVEIVKTSFPIEMPAMSLWTVGDMMGSIMSPTFHSGTVSHPVSHSTSPTFFHQLEFCFNPYQWRTQEFSTGGAYPAFHVLVPSSPNGDTAQLIVVFLRTGFKNKFLNNKLEFCIVPT